MRRVLLLTTLGVVLGGCGPVSSPRTNAPATHPADDTAPRVPTVKLKDFPEKIQLRARTATVRIKNLDKEGAVGSGVFLGRVDGVCRFLTAAHVVKTGDDFELTVFSGDSVVLNIYRKASVVKYDKEQDLALIKMQTTDPMPEPLPVCPEKEVPTTENFPALTVGCGDGYPPTCLAVTVAGKKRVKRPDGDKPFIEVWELTPAQEEGRSGGPLLDAKGRLLGIASGVSDDKSYYAHLSAMRLFLKNTPPNP